MALVQGPRTLTEVSRTAGLSKGTCSRILASLGYQNLVVKTEANTYVLGPGNLRLVNGVMSGFGTIVGAGRAAFEDLWNQTGETIAIHVRVGTERVCVEELPSGAEVRFMSSVGSSAPLYVGSAGRVLLAFLTDTELNRILAASTSSDEGLDVQRLREALDTIRRQQYAVSIGERVRGAAAISVPITTVDGVIASLSILGPDFRLTEERRVEFLPALRGAAARIGAAYTDARHSTRGDGYGVLR